MHTHNNPVGSLFRHATGLQWLHGVKVKTAQPTMHCAAAFTEPERKKECQDVSIQGQVVG